MRIASSQVNMNSNRFYSQMGVKSERQNVNNKAFSDVTTKLYGNVADSMKTGTIGNVDGNSLQSNSFSYSVLGKVLSRFVSSGAFGSASGGNNYQLMTYQESESTSFSAKGIAVTEDGREIDFGVNISMSRQFMQHMSLQIPAMQNALTDPLVINIGTDSAKVSAQKFKFDIDADGVADNISMPTKGSAFLALDKNEDGIINDGNELFGTKSGDGFKDLSEYDSDGNGWIDENDDIFSKLKVWYKDDDGKDVMLSLKDADVGAIFLGEQSSEFSLSDMMGNTSAVIRSSGIFLRESGEVGTIQHVDIAKLSDSELEAMNNGESSLPMDSIGVFNIDANNSWNKVSQARVRKANLEAARARKAANRKLMNEQIEKRRMERKELEERIYENNLERQKMRMELFGF